jgi:hypothetical protein
MRVAAALRQPFAGHHPLEPDGYQDGPLVDDVLHLADDLAVCQQATLDQLEDRRLAYWRPRWEG